MPDAIPLCMDCKHGTPAFSPVFGVDWPNASCIHPSGGEFMAAALGDPDGLQMKPACFHMRRATVATDNGMVAPACGPKGLFWEKR